MLKRDNKLELKKFKMGKKSEKEFGFSSWAINNSTVIWVLISLVLVLGIYGYFSMPREDFPEVKETKIYISSVYPGNTAEDIERLITDPLEERLKNISGVAEILSTTQEDYSIITVEFEEGSIIGTSITVEAAKQKVKDEIDVETSNEDWPTFNGAKIEPNVFDLKMSEEVPIMNINLPNKSRSFSSEKEIPTGQCYQGENDQEDIEKEVLMEELSRYEIFLASKSPHQCYTFSLIPLFLSDCQIQSLKPS